MKRRRLDAVKRLRKVQEDRARAEVAKADEAVRDAADELAARREAAQRREPIPTPLPPKTLFALHLQGLASYENILAASNEYERTLDDRRQRQRELREATIRRRSVEKLAERREAEHLAKVRAAAELALDELVVIERAREGSS